MSFLATKADEDHQKRASSSVTNGACMYPDTVPNVRKWFLTLLGKLTRYLGDNGVGNGNPLQCSCLENSMDRGAWQAIVHRVERVGHD